MSSDCVIRTVFYKYFDPKEALVSNGIINRAIPTAAGKPSGSDQNANAQWDRTFVLWVVVKIDVLNEIILQFKTDSSGKYLI